MTGANASLANAVRVAEERIGRDLEATAGLRLSLTVGLVDPDLPVVTYDVDGAYGGWGGLSIPADDVEAAVAEIADLLREHVLDEEVWGGWPICPRHEHPLDPKVSAGIASWVCPRDESVIVPIGGLPPR